MDPMDPGQDMNPLEGVPLLMLIFFGFVVLCVAVAFALVIVALVRSRRSARAAGYDPMTLQSDMYVRLMQSQALSPSRPLEERLAEIERLHQRGQISAEERAEARQRILGSG